MTWFRWWHKQIRLYTKPKSPEKAASVYGKLSLFYGFLGWNILGFGLYTLVKTKRDSSKSEEDAGLSPGQKLAKEMGKTDAQIFAFKGFKLVRVNPPPTSDVPEEVLKE